LLGFGAQVVPVKRYEGVVMDHGLGITQACMAMTSFSDAPAPNSGLSAIGEIRLMPDISTRRRLPWYFSVSLFLSSSFVEGGVIAPDQPKPRKHLESQGLPVDALFSVLSF
jgi:hypothetical protein